jgi:hypothetical protein
MKYNSWRDLFYWLYFLGNSGELDIIKMPSGYKISCDKISYFPISTSMAKKLIQELDMEVEDYLEVNDEDI